MNEAVLGSVTWQTASNPRISSRCAEACLVLIYPTGPFMGKRYRLGEFPVLIGRDESAAIRVDDHSASRRHARIEWLVDGFVVHDEHSTNGTFVNEVPVKSIFLDNGDYVRVGNCIFRFLAGGNIEADYHEEIHRLAVTDGLTGLANKRHFMDFLNRELARSARHHRPLALCMFDVDNFKAINDRYGHMCGDHVLRELARRIGNEVRTDELLARYGGEEFALVLTEADAIDAVGMAERLRAIVATQPYTYREESVDVTISIGVASTLGDPPLTAEEFIAQADECLYRAKSTGRNCVVA